ncbi:hypothetical protein CEXT_242871 [Caerostris extrusa]|uniref:Uncharacterized protein n=1 Tax=Caerostris extrusa TaxID=172846 RepID=A0AAV4P3M8_CAEEX|nr:hypothetical protein CEXT_242871 [Caerostris extrusa]
MAVLKPEKLVDLILFLNIEEFRLVDINIDRTSIDTSRNVLFGDDENKPIHKLLHREKAFEQRPSGSHGNRLLISSRYRAPIKSRQTMSCKVKGGRMLSSVADWYTVDLCPSVLIALVARTK